jgi:ABC-2 type transport system permease protein
MGPIFALSLHQLAGRWRLFLILALGALPVILVTIIALVTDGFFSWEAGEDDGFIDVFVDGLFVGAIMPIVAIALATAVFGNEIEDRTLSYLMLKPVRRAFVALPKLLAAIAIGGPLLVISGVVSMTLVTGDARAAVSIAAALLAGTVTYSAIFTWAGLVTRGALGFALIYVFVWEGLVSSFLGGVRYLSVRSYTLAIMHGADDETFAEFGGRAIELPAAIGGVVLVTAVFFALTVFSLRRMDVP